MKGVPLLRFDFSHFLSTLKQKTSGSGRRFQYFGLVQIACIRLVTIEYYLPMVQMKATYQGNKHCELNHGPSGSIINTDAPKDNQGLGQAFSPTDLCTVALASCALTTMALQYEKEMPLAGAWTEVQKEMSPAPRKIARIQLRFHLPKNLNAEQKQKLELVAKECPVARSLNPDVKVDCAFIYDV